ncbi:UNVERIFIED_CONTAM: hypothetical protein FKN15_074588 [Acipenser sinensis]
MWNNLLRELTQSQTLSGEIFILCYNSLPMYQCITSEILKRKYHPRPDTWRREYQSQLCSYRYPKHIVYIQ